MGDYVCRICENGQNNRSYIAKEMVYGFRDEFEYFECFRCGCLQIKDLPENLDKYYPQEYYAFDAPRVFKVNPMKDVLKRERTRHALGEKCRAGRVVERIAGPSDLPAWLRGANIKVDHRVLDVGSGSGSFLVYLRSEGFRRLRGVDPFIQADILYENGVAIQKGELAAVAGQFELIMLHHSLEHMPDPGDTFQLLHERLTDDGLLLIRIPTVSSYAWRTYRTNWFQLDAPRHFFLHSVESIEILARKYGFRVQDVRFDSDAKQFWASEQYLRDINHFAENSYRQDPQRSIFTQAQIHEFEQMALELNRKNEGDQACFYLRRSTSTV